MKIFSCIFALCLLGLHVEAVKVFLMGGAVANNQTEIYNSLASATGKTPYPNQCTDDWTTTKCPKIAVATSAAGTENDGNNAYNIDDATSLSYKTLFNQYGFSPKHLSVHIDNYLKTTDINKPEGQLNLDIIKQADIIFFNGGDQTRHSRSWLNDDGSLNKLAQTMFDRLQTNSLILTGTSAGSMVMCSPMYGQGLTYGHLYFANQAGLALKNVADGGINGTGLKDLRNGSRGLQYSDNGGIMAGFNALPFLVDTHVDARGRVGRIVPAMIQTKKSIGVAIAQSTALYYDNGKGTVYGRGGVTILDISNATKLSKEYFALSNVVGSYLTSGDVFDFSTKVTTPDKSKTLIKTPQYSGYVDSTDIFNSQQIPKLITRLGDQTSSSNVGRAKIPSGYSSRAPVFKLTFEKGSKFTSYWSSTQRKYTDVNFLIQYTYE